MPSTPQDQSLPLYQVLSPRKPGDAIALADVLARLSAQDANFTHTRIGRGAEHRLWSRTPAELAKRAAAVAAVASFDLEFGPVMVQPCWTPGRVAEAEHRLGSADGGAGDFAVVRLRIVPRRSGEGNFFESEFAGPPQIDTFNDAVARGVATALTDGIDGEGLVIDTRTIFIDGAFHSTRSTAAGFERAAAAALRAACGLAAMRRLEPLVTIDIQLGRDQVLPVVNDLAAQGGSELRRRLAPSGVVVVAELPMRAFLTYEARLSALTEDRGKLVGEPQLTRWAEVRRTERR